MRLWDEELETTVGRDISTIYSINNNFSLHLRTSSCLLRLLILSTFICAQIFYFNQDDCYSNLFLNNRHFWVNLTWETFGLSFSSNFLSCLNFAGTKVSCELFRSRPLIKNRVR